MKHLQEFIKIIAENDAAAKQAELDEANKPQEKVITVTPHADGYGDLKIKVSFTHTPGGSDRHGDDASFDEDHPDELDVKTAVLAEPVEFTDEDDEVHTFDVGTEVIDLPGWGEADDALIIDAMNG